jgi:hypothetical protein
MSDDFQPGDVAMVTDRVFPGPPVLRIYGEYPPGENGRWYEGHGGFVRAERAVARRVVVIDPEDAEQVERLQEIASRWADDVPYSDMRRKGDLTYTAAMQAALREFAIPTPRIEEPQGWGAVVEDAQGKRFVFTGDRDHGGTWWLAAGEPFRWYAVNAVRVLSPGVPPEATS